MSAFKNVKAQEDAEKLRSVVMPMEHEIAALKSKLTTAEERVKELEASKVSHEGGVNWQGLHLFSLYVAFCAIYFYHYCLTIQHSFNAYWIRIASISLQVKELNHVLEAEKSCRTDLEMYVAVLNTQKSVLQEDAEKLRRELHDGTLLSFNICKAVIFW